MLGYYGKISNQFNLSQIRKRKIREFKDVLTDSSSDQPPRFKEIPSEELKRIKDRIRKESAHEYRLVYRKRLFALGVVIVIFWLIVKFLL